MTATTARLIGSWIAGMIVGTGIIAVTSPWFVRSYLPLQVDQTRGVWTLPPDSQYRWRSEGYADTHIGPLGMPGRRQIPPRHDGVMRVALWGDSQAEGVCVSDQEKLFAQAEVFSGGRLQVFPLARSGEDAADWLTQMGAVERALDLDVHVILAVDLQDLATATQAPLPPPNAADVAAGKASVAAHVPAFVIQAARHLLTESDDTTRRRLRFSVGPVVESQGILGHGVGDADLDGQPQALGAATSPSYSERWRRELQAVRDASSLPILILHAPVVPQIVNGKVVTESDAAKLVSLVKLAADDTGIQFADAQWPLLQAARDGRWPHGFHNGYIGSGHLNAVGNAVVGSVLAQKVLDPMAVRIDAETEKGN